MQGKQVQGKRTERVVARAGSVARYSASETRPWTATGVRGEGHARALKA